MPSWWWILPALAGLLALTILADGLAALAHRRSYRALGEIGVGGAVLALAAMAVLLGLDIQTFSRLSYERPVATFAPHQARLADTVYGSAALMAMADGAPQ
jgi:hypothetical protein